MKQKLFIFIFLILMALLLVGLNAASYSQKEKVPDNEFNPDRSTFNSGATGTQAFFTLLAETGRKVERWQDTPSALRPAKNRNVPTVFVVMGATKREFSSQDLDGLFKWVSGGGRLVLIDRSPVKELLTTTANWQISVKDNDTPELFSVDPSDTNQMTAQTAAMKPAQPTVYTQGVNAVQSSRFAGSVMFERFVDDISDNPPPKAIKRIEPPPAVSNFDAPPPPRKTDRLYEMPTPTPVELGTIRQTVESPSQIAPVVHFSGSDKNLVVSMPFGEGEIVLLSDPYIVSNAGISLVDNAQLAINLVAAGDGIIAFDEYHQGFGKDSNRFLAFFAGTPVVAIFFQTVLFVGLIFYSQSRRFARPVPEPELDRLSKLEYVAAMADLQQRTRAFDLAIENIYNEFRRRVTRLLGLDNLKSTSNEVARAVAERAGLDISATAATLHECEEIIRGEPTNKRQVMRLVGELRAIEQKLGLMRTGRTRI
ncbi:MAG: DUF4350 domain-containing protein [Pyrinomonadaceae bacterium]